MILEVIEIGRNHIDAESKTSQLIRDQLLRSLFLPRQARGLHQVLQVSDQVATQTFDCRDDFWSRILHSLPRVSPSIMLGVSPPRAYAFFLEYALA